jgi:hypothetical protein
LAADRDGEVAVNKTRRGVLMQEAFDLLTQARTLHQLESDNEEVNGGFSIGEQIY